MLPEIQQRIEKERQAALECWLRVVLERIESAVQTTYVPRALAWRAALVAGVICRACDRPYAVAVYPARIGGERIVLLDYYSTARDQRKLTAYVWETAPVEMRGLIVRNSAIQVCNPHLAWSLAQVKYATAWLQNREKQT